MTRVIDAAVTDGSVPKANLFGLDMSSSFELTLGWWSFTFNAGYYVAAIVMLRLSGHPDFQLTVRHYAARREVEPNRMFLPTSSALYFGCFRDFRHVCRSGQWSVGGDGYASRSGAHVLDGW